MFKYPQDSFRLMEQIMQVQDELDRFRVRDKLVLSFFLEWSLNETSSNRFK